MPVAKPELHDAAESAPDVPEDRTLTLAEAAEMLGISEAFINRLVAQEVIPLHMVGKHRRVMRKDVLEYEKIRERGNKAMDFIVAESQRLGLYPKP